MAEGQGEGTSGVEIGRDRVEDRDQRGSKNLIPGSRRSWSIATASYARSVEE